MPPHKIILLGDPNVGKTTLKYCCLSSHHTKDHQTDIRQGFDVTTVTLGSCNLEIWDLQSHKYFYEVADSFLSDFDGALIVFDIGSRISFQNVVNWMDRLHHSSDQPVVIVGNKVDSRQWSTDVVTADEVADMVEQLSNTYNIEIPYFELSSYRGQITQRILTPLLQQICPEYDEMELPA